MIQIYKVIFLKKQIPASAGIFSSKIKNSEISILVSQTQFSNVRRNDYGTTITNLR